MVSRYETEFPDLFARLPAEHVSSVVAALNSDRLEGGTVGRADVELLVRSVTENMTDDEYLAAVLAIVNRSA